jgi:pimeloyl-ACP methyl ester carboxylesterase
MRPSPTSAQPSAGADAQSILAIDHYVVNDSAVPAIAGQKTQIYVRERVKPATVLRGGAAPRVVLFVHGAGTPAEVAFDVPYADYSWMAYLAAAGYDVFSMDMTGYGRSTRPSAMNDVCNLTEEQQRALGAAVCKASYAQQLTTVASDWDDIDAVVEHLRKLRGVAREPVGWSLAARAPAATRRSTRTGRQARRARAGLQPRRRRPTRPNPAAGAPSTQSHAGSPRTGTGRSAAPSSTSPPRATVWGAMLASDPGRDLGTGRATRAEHHSGLVDSREGVRTPTPRSRVCTTSRWRRARPRDVRISAPLTRCWWICRRRTTRDVGAQSPVAVPRVLSGSTPAPSRA